MKNMMKLLAGIALAGLLALSIPVMSAQAQPAATKDAKKSGKVAPAAPVDLNTASQADLEKVPGIGTSTAKKIVAGRPYSSVADLSKAGLSAKQIQTLTPMVTVGAATAAMPKPKAPPVPSMPSATPPVQSPATSSKTTPQASTPANYKPATPPPGPGMVWVNTSTKVFHRAGTKWYGNTKNGKYMSEADALKAGYRESKEKN